ncbi:MAG: B12-binding domain-containing radical SAM protein [Bacteroidota bacterium]
MKILLVCPEYPDTFWSFKHALRFISRKAAQPPLGLLTVASLLPPAWEKRLVDLNLGSLTDDDLRWADIVFLGAMAVQEASARTVITRCNALGRRIVAGGPLFTARHGDFPGVDHFVLNEAELTLPPFLEDLGRGRPERLYTTSAWADLTSTPLPMWELISRRSYATMSLQYSRGCPYDCEFCDITVLYGRAPRTKSAAQVVAELDALYERGWRGNVFFVDDNFIGNREKLKREVLPRIIAWMEARRHPFTLGTEASLNLADDPVLLDLMVRAGFVEVFVGIETPNEESLKECGKTPNRHRDLLSSVRILQQAGLQVQGGFIVGFDHDTASVFDALIRFIQQSGIVVAMVGILNAPVNTRLYHRLRGEKRLLKAITGDNTDLSINFIPAMNLQDLQDGYRRVLAAIYSPRAYYRRVTEFLRIHQPRRHPSGRLRVAHLCALWKSMFVLGVVERERMHYWKLFFWSLLRRPRHFPTAMTLAIYGFHFRRVFEHSL